jgi:glycosyltransferase involved in cell wall biosynthesis
MPRGRPKKVRDKTPQQQIMAPLTVSMVVPCYWVNQELIKITERCLLSYAESGSEVDQLILVNDGSSKGMSPDSYFVSRTKAQTVDVEANRGYTIAVNRGLAAATGEVVIVADNDLLFVQGWLEALLEPLKNGYDISSLPAIGSDSTFTSEPRIVSGEEFGPLFAMTRQALTKLKGLDEDLGRGYFTSLDLQKRAQAVGLKDGKNYKLAVRHVSKSTFKVVDPDGKMYIQAEAAFKKKWGHI